MWYDSLTIIIAAVGIMLAFFGSYDGARRTGIWGWVILMFVLIARASIWVYTEVFLPK